jgi:transcriptional regulator with XRE-family HTH domain
MTATHRTRYCRCGARLARDNTGTRCSACVAADRDRLATAPEVPADFWDEVVLREALASRHMGRVIRAWRTHPYHGRQGLPQARVAAWADITQTQLSRIENGAPMMHLDRLIQWARILRIPPERLWFAMPDSDRQIAIGAASAAVGASTAIQAAWLTPVVTDGELLGAGVNDSPARVPSETIELASVFR